MEFYFAYAIANCKRIANSLNSGKKYLTCFATETTKSNIKLTKYSTEKTEEKSILVSAAHGVELEGRDCMRAGIQGLNPRASKGCKILRSRTKFLAT